MKNNTRCSLLVFLMLPCFLFSCTGLHPSRISTSDMNPHLQYSGFSVERPRNHAWYMINIEQGKSNVLFRRDLATQTHTFVAGVSLESIPRTPESLEDFAEIEKRYHKVEDTQRFELLELTRRIENRQNQWCIYYEEKILDRKAPNSNGRPLVGKARGFVCMHPYFDKTVVHAYYSERGLENEIDSEKIINEGEDFLKGIQIESLTGTPVGITASTEYKRDFKITEIPLFYVDFSSWEPASVKISPDSKRMAYAARAGEKWCVVVNGKAECQYDAILQTTPVFSPDSSRLAYAGKTENKWRVIVDGQEGKQYDAVGPPIFSADSTNMTYVAQTGNKMCLVVNGKEEKQYDGVRAPTFSADSTRLAYAAYSGKKGFIVVDGQEGKQYDAVWTPIFSPDSTRLGYAAKANKKWFVVVDGKEGTYYNNILNNTFMFSPDSKRVAYLATESMKTYVFVDEEKQSYCGLIIKDTLGFSPDSKQVAYKSKSGAVSVVVDGEMGPSYHGILECPPVFSPDSKRMAYVAESRNQMFVVIDGKEDKHYRKILCPPIFSPDSKRIAYQAKTSSGKCCVIVDGKEGKLYDAVRFGPVFSPDSKRVVYAAETDDKLYLVIDGKEIKHNDFFFCGSIRFDTSDELHYLALQGKGRVILVKVECKEKNLPIQ